MNMTSASEFMFEIFSTKTFSFPTIRKFQGKKYPKCTENKTALLIRFSVILCEVVMFIKQNAQLYRDLLIKNIMYQNPT